MVIGARPRAVTRATRATTNFTAPATALHGAAGPPLDKSIDSSTSRVTIAYARFTLGRACFAAYLATNPFSIEHTRPFS